MLLLLNCNQVVPIVEDLLHFLVTLGQYEVALAEFVPLLELEAEDKEVTQLVVVIELVHPLQGHLYLPVLEIHALFPELLQVEQPYPGPFAVEILYQNVTNLLVARAVADLLVMLEKLRFLVPVATVDVFDAGHELVAVEDAGVYSLVLQGLPLLWLNCSRSHQAFLHAMRNSLPRSLECAALIFVPQVGPEQNAVEFSLQLPENSAVLIFSLDQLVFWVAVQKTVVLQKQTHQKFLWVRRVKDGDHLPVSVLCKDKVELVYRHAFQVFIIEEVEHLQQSESRMACDQYPLVSMAVQVHTRVVVVFVSDLVNFEFLLD